MTDPNPETALRDSTVRELLLSYLLDVQGQLWPGADALTLDDLVRAYPRVAATGRVPNCQKLLTLHPELAEILNALFSQVR
jgi:hypothetical protein